MKLYINQQKVALIILLDLILNIAQLGIWEIKYKSLLFQIIDKLKKIKILTLYHSC